MPAVGVSVGVPLVAPWDITVAAAAGVGVSEGVGVSVGVSEGVGVAEARTVGDAVSLGSAVGVLPRSITEFMNASCVSPLARRSRMMHCG
jgi:hypothetical protein